MVRILGIETSCDETAAAIVEDGRFIISNRLATQIEMHEAYGGVVPELAARAHLRAVRPVLESVMSEAGADWDDLDAVAVTHGPGLAGCLLVGLSAAKAIAFARSLPLIGVNHLEGHVYANWLLTPGANDPAEPCFPVVCLVVSGGHTDLVLMRDHGQFQHIGRTVDDAAGEAFDKVARMLGLGFPGGPPIQLAAEHGDPRRFRFTQPRAKSPLDFSFSGLKTAVLRTIQGCSEPIPVADVAASFQATVVESLGSRLLQAANEVGARQIAVAGGVAANGPLRDFIEQRADLPVHIPPIPLCTDNGAMIAAAAFWRFRAGQRDALTLDAIPGLSLG